MDNRNHDLLLYIIGRLGKNPNKYINKSRLLKIDYVKKLMLRLVGYQ